jgi:hypothetical protein
VSLSRLERIRLEKTSVGEEEGVVIRATAELEG